MTFKGVIFDLDGTVYRGKEAVPGAADFIRRLRDRGVRVLFVTNRANRPPAVVAEQLRSLGVSCETQDVLTSAEATAAFLRPGTVYYIGETGMREALDQYGFQIVDHAPDYVIASFDREFNYAKLSTACRLILNGAQFIATNPDRALRMEQGLSPGTGSIVAAIQAATGVAPLFIGKPERRILDMALRKMQLTAEDVIAVGDNLETDIPAGHAAGMRTVFILTGFSTRDDLARSPIVPTWTVDGYDDLVRLFLP